MCLILFAYKSIPGWPLIVAANRDEFHGRAASQAGFWQDHINILAGRDLVAGGTWLGCTRTGRFAALTNFSSPKDPANGSSRGDLVAGFLNSDKGAEHYADEIRSHHYAGFNLLLYDGHAMVCTSNRGPTQVLSPGYYGLANAQFGAQWPKCVRGAQSLADITAREHATSELLDLMADRSVPPDESLPRRGRDVDLERKVAPCFILGDEYGTRASTIVHVSDHSIRFVEQSYAAGGHRTEKVEYMVELANAGAI